MEKSMQRYLVLFKVSAGKGGEFWEGFSKLSAKPRTGVQLEVSYSLFGKWDFALLFEADSNENALHFIGETLRSVSGISETFTTPLTLLKQYSAK